MSWWKFSGGAVRFLSRLVDVVTADSAGRCWTRAALLFMGSAALAAAALGTIVGAEVAVTGGSLSTVTSALHGVEIELWNSAARDGPAARALYGLMHWAILLTIFIADAGARAGFALPVLGYVAEGAQLLLLAGFASAWLNCLEALRLVYWRPDDPGDGGEPA